jgi:hypothetical protein
MICFVSGEYEAGDSHECVWSLCVSRIQKAFWNAPKKFQAMRGYHQTFPHWVDNEIYTYNNKHSLRSNTKGYGSKTHYTDSQNGDKTASSGRGLYHL